MPKIEMGKQYRTRDGRSVRIICTDRQADFPIVALVTDPERNVEVMLCYYSDGLVDPGSKHNPLDLIEVKPRIKQTFWFNIYKDPQLTCRHMNKKDADKWQSGGRLACVKIEIDCEEGEGLS